MNQIIEITTNENDEQLVSARELHKSLEVKTRFSQWVSQNFKGFRENIDFTSVVSTTVVNNGAVRELQDYALSVEMAKHIAMMTGTPKGYEVRDYFIQVEKAWNNPDMIIKRAMDLQARKIVMLETKVDELKPKALFAEAVESSKGSILVRDLAKILKQNNVEIGEKRLFAWLRDNGYLIKKLGSDYNSPTQRSMNLGVMEFTENTVVRNSGDVILRKTPKVTGKGQTYFVGKFLNSGLAIG
ncbi:oxidoreductase [Pseudolactococcus raffinolactis]|uniref:phage antirepressor KilAC domain-containing protein n=1 Tax=Pseudolactococcus raffinolactis TaxID=1366 RepID=UPI00143715FF|nr:phage antirepressor KilAC domain-containing protein [Lactococcus raffinolactis]QIW56412.1 oxidoreductase [Lactococcus raffinolactis]